MLALLAIVFGCVLVVANIVALPQSVIDLLSNPGGARVINSVMVLEGVQSIALLDAARYDYAIWVSSERELPGLMSALRGLYGDRVEYVAVGYVTAGIDLAQLGEESIQVGEDGHVLLTLPHARLTNCVLDESRSYVVERSTGVFVGPSPAIDEAVREFALQQFIGGAMESNILIEAESQAAAVLRALILALGAPEATIAFSGDAPTPTDSTCLVAPSPATPAATPTSPAP